MTSDIPLTTKDKFGPRFGETTLGSGSVTGELVGASEREVTIAAGDGILTIPYEQIVRSNLIPGD